MSH
ncbi:hypothetical protein YPPY04_1613, partial [Yersinia pestis PY-04]|jgi:NitT/TauT family transport system ATP-binding protein